MREFFLILIGANIGAVIGWFACKCFNGDMECLMKWFDGEEKKGRAQASKFSVPTKG